MDSGCKFLWAKKDDKGGKLKWLPLLVHLEDTMNVADFLWNHWLPEGQKNDILSGIEPSNETICENLVCFLGAAHDIGKATPAFQTQRVFSNGLDLDSQLLEKLERAGFTGISSLALASAKDTHHTRAGQAILEGHGVRKDIASIIGSHHGKPLDEDIDVQTELDAYAANYFQVENSNNPIYQKWKAVQSDLLEWALQESDIERVDNLPELSKPDQVLLSGLLIMADWIASNEAYFPLIPIDKNEIDNPSKRFEFGIKEWIKDYPIEFENRLQSTDFYQKRFGLKPRDFQKRIYEDLQSAKQPGLVIIEAPTGGGKTEAALAAFEQLATKAGRSGMFFGLPTQATSNSMFSRIESWLENVTKEYGKTSLRLQHGKAALNPLMRKLSAQHIDTDDNKDSGSASIQVNQWFSGRKTASLDNFVVGTVDNFLLVALKQKHLALRHLGFDRKVVIIDEVHAYDAYMQQYLEEAIRWMGTYGVPVILLSATLPMQKRIDFVSAYLQGTGLKKRDFQDSLSKISENRLAFPLLTYTDENKIEQDIDFEKQAGRKIEIRPLEESNILTTLKDLTAHGGIVGIIVNTVRRAQELARQCAELFGKENIEVLHACFLDSDRIQKETRLINEIGKVAKRPEKKIVIDTQVIEQSLDIDFDALITDLCPMDLLIQRIGRLHRHSNVSRPSNLQKPVCYVLGENSEFDFEPGSVAVYGEYLLMRTQCYLTREINIPNDVSHLVQDVYGMEKDPFISSSYQGKYQKAKADFNAFIEIQRKKASGFRIENPSQKINPDRYNLISWLNSENRSDTDEKSYAQVRDIQETVEVIGVKSFSSGYSYIHPQSEESDISKEIQQDSVAKKLATQTIRLPQIVIKSMGGAERLIEWLEDYNLKHLKEWQSQVWLKGSLGIIFDENGDFHFSECRYFLHYDDFYGLEVKSEEKNEQI